MSAILCHRERSFSCHFFRKIKHYSIILRLSIFLKSFLENQLWRNSSSPTETTTTTTASNLYSLNLLDLVTPEEKEETSSESTDSSSDLLQQQQQQQQGLNLVMERGALKPLQQQVDAIDSSIKSYLPGCRFGTAERCLLVAQLFGDESAALFWLMALHYLERQTASASSASEKGNSDGKSPSDSSRWSLPLSMDILLGNDIYKDYQLKRLSLQDARASTYEQISQCTENSIYLGLFAR